MLIKKLKREKKQFEDTNGLLNMIREKSSVNENKLFFESFEGKKMGGDPYALFKYILNDKKYLNFEFIWVLNDKKKINNLDYVKDKRIKFVKRDTKKYMYHLCTSKILINNMSFPVNFIKKDSQIYINMYPEIPYKKIGKDILQERALHANQTSNFLKSDYLVCTNNFTKEKVLTSHDIEDIWVGEIITSSPRYSLCKKNPVVKNYLEQIHNVNFANETILYAPTSTDELGNIVKTNNQIMNELQLLKEKFPEKNILLQVDDPHSIKFENDEKQNYLDGEYDIAEVMYYIDTLITDYSSLIFDFSYFKKKIIHYIPEYNQYYHKRGLYFEFVDLPGIVAHNIDDLIESINSEKIINYQKYNEFFNQTNILEEIPKILTKIVEKPKPVRSNKKNVMVYAGGFEANGITKSFINLTKKWDYEKYNLILIDKNKWRDDQETILGQIDPRVKILYRSGRLVMSREERRNYHAFINNPEDTGNYQYVEKIMIRENKRLFGNIDVNYVIDFSGYMYFWSLLLNSMPNTKKIIFQHNNMYLESQKKINDVQVHAQKLNIEFNIYNWFDKVISVSKETQEENYRNLSKYYSWDKSDYIENFIDEKEIEDKLNMIDKQMVEIEKKVKQMVGKPKIANNHDSKIITNQVIKIGYFGRISPEKGQLNFVNKIPELIQYFPNLIVIFGGTGADEEAINKKIITENLQNNVLMAGYIENPYAIMKQLDYTVLLSSSEGQPMVLLESILIGTKVIASNIPGCQSVLKGKYGYCIENSTEAFINALKNEIKLERFNVKKYNDSILEKYKNHLTD